MTANVANRKPHPAPEPVYLTPEKPQVEDIVRDGLRALDRMDFEEATRLFRQALALAPFRADVKELLALALDERPFKASELHAERFTGKAPRAEAVHPLQGIHHQSRRTAVSWLGKPLIVLTAAAALALGAYGGWRIGVAPAAANKQQAESQQVAGAIAKAKTLMRDGRFDHAIQALDQALKLEPASAESINQIKAQCHYQKGIIQHENRNYSAAIGAFTLAADLAPGNVDYRYQLGLARHMRGRIAEREAPAEAKEYFAQARKDFEQALALDPKHIDAIYGLGLAASAQGDAKAAIAAFEQVVSLAPTSYDGRAAKRKLDVMKAEGQ